jgi:hypothetical protein
MKKRRVNWPYGNPDFTAFEVESAAGVLVARRNHALVRTGERVTRAACCGRHHDFQPDQPSLLSRPKGGFRPNAGRPPKGGAKRVKLSLSLDGQTIELIDARRGERSRGEYLDSLVLLIVSFGKVA